MDPAVITAINITGLGDIMEFTSLSIHQTLADTCGGSFGYRDEGSTTLKGQIAFHNKIMGKTVTVSIGPDFTFIGFVDNMRMHNEDGLASEYIISFTGEWGKLDQHTECHAWADRKFNDIIKDLEKGLATGTTPNENPLVNRAPAPVYGNAHTIADWPTEPDINAKPLYWTVQLNKTRWQQIKFMSARAGAWLYYDGVKMHMAPPGAQKLTLTKGTDIFNITHSKSAVAVPVTLTGFNTFEGEKMIAVIDAPQGNDIHQSAVSSGATLVTSADGSVHVGTAFDHEELKHKGLLYQRAKTANSVIFTATTHETGVTPGMLLTIAEGDDSNESHEFIVTQVAHSASGNSSYTAYLTMIPSSVEVPPYSNPFLYTPADKMHGIVTDNFDSKHKKDRVQLNLPWMQPGEQTNWMDVLTNYAGKGKGHIWLPEVGEEVLVDFVSGDAERPFVSGAIFTKKNLSEREPDEGNHVKSMTTGSGRGIVIDDKEGKIRFQDNEKGSFPENGLILIRNDSENGAQLQSAEDAKNFAVIHLIGKSGMTMRVFDDGILKYEIRLDKDAQKVLVHSAGDIELIAGGNIKLQAKKIEIAASDELRMSGTSGGATLEGQKVEISAQTDIKASANASLELSGLQAKLAGSAQVEVSGGAMANVHAAMVKIN